MLDDNIVELLASELDHAEQTREQVTQFSTRHPEMTVDDGYRIQQAWVRLKQARGQKIMGHKIGLTSRAMQMASQVDEPDFGALLDPMFLPEGQAVPIDHFIVPRVEVELAFVLGDSLEGEQTTIFDVLNATDYVTPAIEIIDARIEAIDRATGVTRKVVDTISDNAANAGIMTGGRPVTPDSIDLRWAGALLYRNGVIEETGLAAGVLNHPATGVAWLVRRLAAHGHRLEAGEVVLSGSFTRPVTAKATDTFHADFGPLGNVTFQFV